MPGGCLASRELTDVMLIGEQAKRVHNWLTCVAWLPEARRHPSFRALLPLARCDASSTWQTADWEDESGTAGILRYADSLRSPAYIPLTLHFTNEEGGGRETPSQPRVADTPQSLPSSTRATWSPPDSGHAHDSGMVWSPVTEKEETREDLLEQVRGVASQLESKYSWRRQKPAADSPG